MIVLDASVIIKWFQEEEGSDRALVIQQRHERGEDMIVVPALALYEITNVLRYRRLTTEKVETILDILEDLEMGVFSFSSAELKEVLRFARKHDLSVYDAVYAVLAERLGCSLITADQKLHKKLQTLPWVTLL